jgi:hypothetical protein
MRAILIVVAVVAVMVLLGWITFSTVGSRTAVTFETDVIKEDAETAVEATREAASRVAEQGERLVDEARRTEVDVDVRRRPTESD